MPQPPALPEHLYCEQDDDILHVPRLQFRTTCDDVVRPM